MTAQGGLRRGESHCVGYFGGGGGGGAQPKQAQSQKGGASGQGLDLSHRKSIGSSFNNF